VVGISLPIDLCLFGRLFRGKAVRQVSFGGGGGCVVEWRWWFVLRWWWRRQ